MFADQLRAAIEAANRITLPQVTALLWRAYGEGRVTEAEAESLSAMVEARLTRVTDRGAPTRNGCGQDGNGDRREADSPEDRQSSPRRPGVGSRPRTDASMERRRRWAASGRLPPGLAARFTPGEIAVLSLIAAEVARRKDCRLAIEQMAAVAGVCRSTVKNAVREARKLGLITVEERPVTGFRNLPNIVRVVSPEWTAWLRLARKTNATNFVGLPDYPSPAQGGGVKSSTRTPTEVLDLCESRPAAPSQGLPRGSGQPRPERASGIVASGRAGGAMR